VLRSFNVNRSLVCAACMTFIFSYLLMIAQSIIDGMYYSTLNDITSKTGHLYIYFSRHVNISEVNNTIKKITSFKDIVRIQSLGRHYGFVQTEDRYIPVQIIACNDQSLCNIPLKGNKVVMSSFLQKLKDQNIIGSRLLINVIHNFSGKDPDIKSFPVNLDRVVVEYDSYFDIPGGIIINAQSFYNMTEILPINEIQIFLTNDNQKIYSLLIPSLKAVIPKTCIIMPWYELYQDAGKMLALEYYSGIMICFIFTVLFFIIIYGSVNLFLEEQKRNITGFILLGIKPVMLCVIIGIYLLLIMLGSIIVGGSLGYVSALLFDYWGVFNVIFLQKSYAIQLIPHFTSIYIHMFVTIGGIALILANLHNKIPVRILETLSE